MIQRFLLLSSLFVLTVHAGAQQDAASRDAAVLGHGSARYRVDMKWAKADPAVAPVINSHAMAESRDGHISRHGSSEE
jgi:hypothetical protein